MGSKKNVDMTSTEDTVKIVETNDAAAPAENGEEQAQAPKVSAPRRVRSKKYKAMRAKIDKTRKYGVLQAVEMVNELSYSSFQGTITAALVVKELGQVGAVTLPHQTGQSRNIVIVDDKVLEKIEAGEIDDIDVLIAEPQYMPKLAKYGKTLGPKGLMPNPKSGTLTPNPEAKIEELAAGKMMLKTNKKQPVLHVTVGKTSMKAADVAENIESLVNQLRSKLVKLSIAATMSPGVRVDLQSVKKEK